MNSNWISAQIIVDKASTYCLLSDSTVQPNREWSLIQASLQDNLPVCVKHLPAVHYFYSNCSCTSSLPSAGGQKWYSLRYMTSDKHAGPEAGRLVKGGAWSFSRWCEQYRSLGGQHFQALYVVLFYMSGSSFQRPLLSNDTWNLSSRKAPQVRNASTKTVQNNFSSITKGFKTDKHRK